jgi:antitoxin MazE
MEVSLVQIGNSRGICLPNKIIEQCQIDNKLTLTVEGDNIILESKRKTPRVTRLSWAEAAKQMHKNNDDVLLIPDVFDDEDFPEW